MIRIVPLVILSHSEYHYINFCYPVFGAPHVYAKQIVDIKGHSALQLNGVAVLNLDNA